MTTGFYQDAFIQMKEENRLNRYAVVRFSPKLSTDLTLFLFEHGRYFTDDEMSDYILWAWRQWIGIEDVRLRVPWEECPRQRQAMSMSIGIVSQDLISSI